jgi:hypothetical protein
MRPQSATSHLLALQLLEQRACIEALSVLVAHAENGFSHARYQLTSRAPLKLHGSDAHGVLAHDTLLLGALGPGQLAQLAHHELAHLHLPLPVPHSLLHDAITHPARHAARQSAHSLVLGGAAGGVGRQRIEGMDALVALAQAPLGLGQPLVRQPQLLRAVGRKVQPLHRRTSQHQ